MRIDLGEIFERRALVFPVFRKEPKKAPSSWGLFPEFTLDERQLAESLEYRYPAFLYSASQAQLSAMTDRAIDAGREPIEAGRFELWLHATKIDPVMRVAGKALYVAKILFIFRARKVFLMEEANLSGSIAEIPQIVAAEDLKKEKPNEEVKNNG